MNRKKDTWKRGKKTRKISATESLQEFVFYAFFLNTKWNDTKWRLIIITLFTLTFSNELILRYSHTDLFAQFLMVSTQPQKQVRHICTVIVRELVIIRESGIAYFCTKCFETFRVHECTNWAHAEKHAKMKCTICPLKTAQKLSVEWWTLHALSKHHIGDKSIRVPPNISTHELPNIPLVTPSLQLVIKKVVGGEE